MARKQAATAVYVRMPYDLHLALKRKAEREERTIASLVRVAVRQYVNGDK